MITGSALIALGLGMLMLFALARRTDQPQPWALAPAVGLGVAGLALLILGPSGRVLGWLGWVWPLLLAALVVWSWRGARHSLHNWSRRALLYPCFVILGLVALGGAYETIAEATTSNEPTTGRTYLVAGHRLYLSCAGSGSPTVVLFNGLAERTPSWAWVQRGRRGQRRASVSSIAPARAGVARRPVSRTHISSPLMWMAFLPAANIPGPYVVAGHSVGGAYALAYAMDYPEEGCWSRVDRLGHSVSVRSADVSALLLDVAARVGAVADARPSRCRPRLLAWHGRQHAAAGCPSPGASVQFPRHARCEPIATSSLELRTVLRQDQALTSLDGKPLFVLTADLGQQSGWFASQDKLATLSTNSAHQTTKGATHVALLEDEHYAAVSSRAIAAVVRSVRTGDAAPALDLNFASLRGTSSVSVAVVPLRASEVVPQVRL